MCLIKTNSRVIDPSANTIPGRFHGRVTVVQGKVLGISFEAFFALAFFFNMSVRIKKMQ